MYIEMFLSGYRPEGVWVRGMERAACRDIQLPGLVSIQGGTRRLRHQSHGETLEVKRRLTIQNGVHVGASITSMHNGYTLFTVQCANKILHFTWTEYTPFVHLGQESNLL